MNGNESCNRCESVESTEPLKGKEDSYVCNLCKCCTKEVKEYLELPYDHRQGSADKPKVFSQPIG